MSYDSTTPMDLTDTLVGLINEIDQNGMLVRGVTVREPTNLAKGRAFAVDQPRVFINDLVNATPVVGAAYVSSAPQQTKTNAGQEILTFVILIAVETTSAQNAQARKAQDLLYNLQGALHGRDAGIGRPWQWAGHGLILDDDNDNFQVYQQTWTLLHSFNGYSGN